MGRWFQEAADKLSAGFSSNAIVDVLRKSPIVGPQTVSARSMVNANGTPYVNGISKVPKNSFIVGFGG